MTWAGHDHGGEYAAAGHSHDRFDVYCVADEHHRHYHTESELAGLREDLNRALGRISELEDRVAALEPIDLYPAEEPGSADYDPGPEADDEGGMSEYRYPITAEEPWGPQRP